MIDDGREIPDGSVLDADVCIVGAGPAGLTLAQELGERGLAVVLLESGSTMAEPTARALLTAETDPDPGPDLYPDIGTLRDAGIGGTARQWCIEIDGRIWVRMAALDALDYRARSWLPYSGWPIDEATLAPYVARAMRRAGCAPAPFDPAPWIDGEHGAFHFAHGLVEPGLFLFAPRDAFTRDARIAIEARRNVRCLTMSCAVMLETGPRADAVSAVRVRSLGGGSFRVRASEVILAQGGFEVPRLLLASNDIVASGLGNAHGLVGRFLMDHQIIDAGILRASDGGLPRGASGYDMRRRGPAHGLLSFRLATDVREREALLSATTLLLPHARRSLRRRIQRPFGRGVTWRSPARRALRELRCAMPKGLAGSVRRLESVVRGLDDVLYHQTRYRRAFRPAFDIDHGGWSELADRESRFDGLDVFLLCEQAPDPDNRITLGTERDALGVPRPRVRFRWNPIDQRSAARSQELLAAALADAGIGELRYERRDGLPLVTQMSTHHPAGTARMSVSPRDGVVDPDCRVHGMRNLHIASSAVFPTAGHANPTLTILALAIRVADGIAASLMDARRAPAPGRGQGIGPG
ncbi:MAG: FAD-dependent oxidoreductase [Burkholderiaceae bacterium]|nr:FAD-dependent oxidoreductase [Burkholderiaceae bacterium]MEB2318760.1 FAD-dependent oxidoreductase [Pseudomonadota bacterium]